MTSRLLLVEPSTTMRFVLDNYVQSLGHTVVSVGDYHEAVEALRDQFQSFDDDFDAIILGWPSIAVREADTLTALLEQDDFHALSVVVMSTDQRAETRAWVADRPNSAMLAWKSYESINEVLQSLTQVNGGSSHTIDSVSSKSSVVKFDNSDIGVLLIDDSPSIRESLSNVLNLHGYRIQAVANREEALRVIRAEPIDVAIVDFYLQDETGDQVCRDIINVNPSIVCAILTSAYSDPIIKLSLRAGAVDCFFKNEAGELLLARIDALSRVVRQRKALSAEQIRLDRLVESLAGATLLLDDSNQLTYVSEQAAKQLGYSDRRELVGQAVSAVLDAEKLTQMGPGRHKAQWVNAEQSTVDVVYRMIHLAGTTERMLNFKFSTIAGTETAATESEAAVANAATSVLPGTTGSKANYDPISLADTLKSPLDSSADTFLRQMFKYLEALSSSSDLVSLLILGVYFRYKDGSIMPVSEHPDLQRLTQNSMLAIYRRENHVACLTKHRFGFLLRHNDSPQSYLLTRKIMQLCNETPLPDSLEGKGELCVNGCLLGLENQAGEAANEVLIRALSGLRAVDVRGVNQALLLDLKRMLPVYPEN